MATKPKAPILPRDPRDPMGIDKLERGAMREFAKRMRRVRDLYKTAIKRFPYEPVVNARYAFRLDAALLAAILSNLDFEVDLLLMGESASSTGTWFFESYVAVAMARGTAQEFANLSRQSAAYLADKVDMATIMRSDPYRLRIALMRAREFEEMKGLTGQVKADMSRILTEGLARGLNPLDIARNMNEQTGIEEYRANRIARTEIGTALRRAKWDEADDATERLGLTTKEMHLSALSPTTRATHAARHGKLYTVEECRDWWAQGAESINCKCATTSVLVDKDDNPVVPGIIEAAMRSKKIMEERDYEWSKD